VALTKRDISSITNVKTHTKHFCKKEHWADAPGARLTHQCNDGAYQSLTMQVNGHRLRRHLTCGGQNAHDTAGLCWWAHTVCAMLHSTHCLGWQWLHL
jgi:hypothetical protein